MRRLRGLVALMAVLGALGLAAGCVESSEEDARTPEGAATVANTAIQTDAEGNTITAPATPPRGEPTTPGGPPGQPPPAGDAAAGQQLFAATCSACHMNNGRSAGGVGPQLAGQGLDEALVRETVTNGRGAMPGGLVSGTDLDNVVAYVLSIQ
ncbi:MAG: cytochrome c [Thermoleophilia bacterium]|nr:cytochrome c [Thermoleophilia bacterium]